MERHHRPSLVPAQQGSFASQRATRVPAPPFQLGFWAALLLGFAFLILHQVLIRGRSQLRDIVLCEGRDVLPGQMPALTLRGWGRCGDYLQPAPVRGGYSL